MTSNDDKLAGSTDSAEPLKKKSLSKYGPFNQSAIASRGNDSDEEYGVLVREEGSEEVKQTKKSLSKYGSHSVERIVVVKEEEEEYGSFDPNFKLEKVAHTSKGELVVIPENPTPKTIKKTLSKYGTPSSAQKTPVSVRSADSDDEDYGNLEPNNAEQKKIKKSLSKYSPKNSVNNFEGKLSFENIKIDSDEEYGELDPNFKPVPVAVTSSGHYVVPPEADPNKKVMKKTLSKYNVSTVVKSPPKVVKIGDDSDEEYGTLEKEAENNTPASGKKIKKTLSKYKDVNVTTSPAVAPVAAADILKSNDSDEEYGKDIDTSYLDSARATSRKSLTQSLSPINSVSKSRSDDTTTSNGEVVVESLAPVKALVAKIEKNKVNN